ncbi:MAG: SDR family NAD(P)-dependent oxidoreductase [Pseudomonadota bacterium]
MSGLYDLAGKKLLVVGAGSGIGLATAQQAVEAGAKVAATVFNENQQATIDATGVAWSGVVDVRDEDLATAVEDAAGALGGLDAVILTAGIFDYRRITDTQPEDWQRIIDTNLGAAYRVSRVTVSLFERQRRGSLVLVSSQVGIIGHPRAAAYAASKAGINGLVRALALELAPFGARANAVAPGPIATPMTETARGDPDRRQWLIDQIPLGRFGEANEVARVLLFLASDAASYVTGQVLPVDGGVTTR